MISATVELSAVERGVRKMACLYTAQYDSPLGEITLACNKETIIGLWFNGQKHFGATLPAEGNSTAVAPIGNRPLAQNGHPPLAPTGYPLLVPNGSPTLAQNGNPLLEDARRWLDLYFSGQNPDFLPPLQYSTTPFRKAVYDILLTIPYGETMTYGQIAAKVAEQQGIEKMSAQAVGGAVGRNPIALMIPCHRVVGTGGNLTGYAGGLDRKLKLLELEKADTSHLFMPAAHL
jgi:methylated-DNA-[protein]-cysteine S-methyltransferase